MDTAIELLKEFLNVHDEHCQHESRVAERARRLIAMGEKSDNGQWLWPGWIPRGSLTLLLSNPRAGKTRLMLDLVSRLMENSCWPDGQMVNMKEAEVIWYQDDAVHLVHDIQDLCLSQARFLFDDNYDFSDVDMRDAVERQLYRNRPALVVMDNPIRDGDLLMTIISWLQRISDEYKTAVVIIHDTNRQHVNLSRAVTPYVRSVLQLSIVPHTMNIVRRLSVVGSTIITEYPTQLDMELGINYRLAQDGQSKVEVV